MTKKIDLGAVLEGLEKATRHMPAESRKELFAEMAVQMVEKIDFAGGSVKLPEKYSKIIIEYHVGRQEYTLASDFAEKVGIESGLKKIKQKVEEEIPGRTSFGCY